MYLGRIIGTGTKISILDVLINRNSPFVESALAKAAGIAVSEINRQMPDLVASGLVRLERVGRAKLYSINRKHFLFPPMKRLFADLNRKYLEAAKKICRFAVSSSKDVRAVILIGSVAKGTVRSDLVKEPSDIDLIFVTKGNKEGLFNSLISYINNDISLAYGISCYPVVVTEKEYLKALEAKDRFIVLAHSEGVELHGRKPRRFG